jgi:hypothetical protein
LSADKFKPHVFVLPEDDANKELANGFLLRVDQTRGRQMDVLRVARGRDKVLERFKLDHVTDMVNYPKRFMVLLMDFDGRKDLLESARTSIPENLLNRVFVLGVLTEPEALKAALGRTYEEIGLAMADDCRDGTDTTWGHDLLRHNASELERLRKHVCSILF